MAGAFGAAALLNLLDALVALDGWAWSAVRAAVAAAFGVAVILWIAHVWRQRSG